MDGRDAAPDSSGRRARNAASRTDEGAQVLCSADPPSLSFPAAAQMGQFEAIASPEEIGAHGTHQRPSYHGELDSSAERRLQGPRLLGLAAETSLASSSPRSFSLPPDAVDAAMRRQVLLNVLQTQALVPAQEMVSMAPLPLYPSAWAGFTGAVPAPFPIQLSSMSGPFLLVGGGPVLRSPYPPTIMVGNANRLDFDAPTHFRSHPTPSSGHPMVDLTAARPRPFDVSDPAASLASHSPSTNVARGSAKQGGNNPPAPAPAERSQRRASQHDDSSTPLSTQVVSGRPKETIPMWLDGDEKAMTRYQCLLRRQIEYFVADHDDLQVKAQGRNRPIRVGQVGIRCRHCAKSNESGGVSTGSPDSHHSSRNNQEGTAGNRNINPRRGSVYYPSKVSTLFQAVQNMACNHFASGACASIPRSILEEIVSLKETKTAQAQRGAGKRYWAQSAARLGIVDARSSDGTTGGSWLMLRRR